MTNCEGRNATPQNLANLTNQEQWVGLYELAYNEHDQEKLGALFEEMLRPSGRPTDAA
jgi:hypothetical protein